MPLICGCDEWGEWDGEGVGHYPPTDYTAAPATGRRRRCASCGEIIPHGAVATRWERFRAPLTDVEARIYGEDAEVPLASWWHCERCADLYFSLTDLGYCVYPAEDMRELAREYAAMRAGEDQP